MVDIVMASYNGEKFIREQIDSIIQNTYKNWRLFVCDDGSCDKTSQIVKEYERQYPDKIFWKPNAVNKGIVVNFLDGAKQCTSNYIMFCDQDDVWLPRKIELTLFRMKQLEKKYGIDMPITVFTDACVVDENLKILENSFHKSSKLDTRKLNLSYMLIENKMMGCTMMINKALNQLITVVPKCVRMHDWWIGMIAAAFGKIFYENQPSMLYRQHGDNTVGNQKFTVKKITGQIITAKKQKIVIKKTLKQAEYFYHIYIGSLSKYQRMLIQEFYMMQKENAVKKRYCFIKYRFFKSGIIRNIGLFLVI